MPNLDVTTGPESEQAMLDAFALQTAAPAPYQPPADLPSTSLVRSWSMRKLSSLLGKLVEGVRASEPLVAPPSANGKIRVYAADGSVAYVDLPTGGGGGEPAAVDVNMNVAGQVPIYGPPPTGKSAIPKQWGVYIPNSFFGSVTWRFYVQSSIGGSGYYLDPITLSNGGTGQLWLFRPRWNADYPGLSDGEYSLGRLVAGASGRIFVDVQSTRNTTLRFYTWTDLV